MMIAGLLATESVGKPRLVGGLVRVWRLMRVVCVCTVPAVEPRGQSQGGRRHLFSLTAPIPVPNQHDAWIDRPRYLLPPLSNNERIWYKIEPSLRSFLLPGAAAARYKPCRIVDHRFSCATGERQCQ